MSFIETVSEAAATGAVAAQYRAARDMHGYVPNYEKTFSHRPDVMAAWEALSVAIRGHLGTRRYRLATLAAARVLGSSYCMMAHGRAFLGEGADEATLAAIARGEAAPGLDAAERAIVTFAGKVAREATAITQHDVDALKAQGLTDAEVFDVATAAAVRCFFAKTLDATGTRPDRSYSGYPPALLAALTVGRPAET